VQSATKFPGQPAVSRGAKVVLSYGQLMARASRLAGSLRDELGLRPGDRVSVAMPNVSAYLEVLFSIWHAGLCAVPMNFRLHSREIAYILDSAEAKVCFVSADTEAAVAPLLDELPSLRRVISVEDNSYDALLSGDGIELVETSAATPAWLFYTSGTTGRPKGATLSHNNLRLMAESHYADIRSMRPTDTMIHAAPLSHGCGLWSIASVGRAANNVVLDGPSYDPEEICRLIERWPDISMYHAPTMLKRLVNSPAIANTDTNNLHTLIYGGSHMYVADLQRSLAVLGPKLVQIYGQGECPNTITLLGKEQHAQIDHPHHLDRLGSAGVARTGVEIRVADSEDRAVPTGELGEVLVRSDIVMSGYWRRPEESSKALRSGWLHTGDVGMIDAEGFLTLKDRSKDMIISGGSNIYPREIEEVLLRHPQILEVSVLGRDHAEWGEEVVAVVVARKGCQVDPAELDELCLSNIARYKRPRLYHFIDELPKNNYGKILKTSLRTFLASDKPKE
jgi:acyl-CoA synthetase (AMP-forming)/AMP-acid ligase II